MNILEALQEVRKLTHKRSQGVIYQLADVKEAVFKLCDIVEAAYEETGPVARDVLVAEGGYSDEALRKVQEERNALLRAIQDIQMYVWPNDTELFGVSKEAPIEDLDNFVGMIKDEYRKLRQRLLEAQEGREDMRRAMLAQRQRPPAPDLYVGRGRYEAVVAERGILQGKLRYVWNLAHALAEGLRLTQEYIGDEALPPETGWSWYDALMKYHSSMGLSHDNHANTDYAHETSADEDCDDDECS